MPAAGIPFGHFILQRRLARGGMAEVFLARQRGVEGFDRRVAVKRILPHLSERADFVKMFLDEARLAARLSHPNIVHIYEFGKVDEDYFIAMEYVDGVHAGQLIKRAADEALPAALVARVGADAASALAYAHRLEDADGTPLAVVHRDISPQNVMISYDGVVKLVDFGIAKAAATAGDETQPGVVKGKYAYMSPEQTVGKPLDGRSDVFSLGLCLWEMLAGRHVVDRKNPADAMRAIRDGRFPAIEDVAPAVPAPLAAAIGSALAVDREERATAAELGVALESFIKASPDMATAMQLAEWIRDRFPRPSTTASHPALPAVDTPPRPGTRATHVATAASSVAPLPMPPPPRLPPPPRPPSTMTTKPIALPPREATILHTALGSGVDLDHDIETGTDDFTAIVAPPRPATAPAPGGRRWAVRLVVAAALAAGVLAGAWAFGAFGGGGAAPAPDAAVVVITAPAPDAGATITAIAPDAAPADAAPAAPKLASLDVVTTPAGATVRLVGRSAAGQRSPASFLDLEPGPVTIRVDLDGHEPLTRDLDLAPGERRTLDLALAPKRAPVRDHPRDRKPAPGILNVRTTPYSVVYRGSKKLGETPFVLELPAGTYTLTFKNPSRRPVTRKVTIRAGETTKLKFDL